MNQRYYEDSDGRYIVWDFAPTVAPREGHAGENIYSQHWLQTMLTPEFAFVKMDEGRHTYRIDLWDIDHSGSKIPLVDMFGYAPEQRHVTLVTDLMKWLGTNAGINFRDSAKKLRDDLSILDKPMAHLMIWAQDNVWDRMVSAGSTPRRFLLSSFYKASGSLEKYSDVEALELAVMWLDKEKGQQFLQRCDAAMTAHYEQQKAARMAAYGLSKNNP